MYAVRAVMILVSAWTIFIGNNFAQYVIVIQVTILLLVYHVHCQNRFIHTCSIVISLAQYRGLHRYLWVSTVNSNTGYQYVKFGIGVASSCTHILSTHF